MKKLIVCIVAGIATCIVNAATVNWNMSGLMDLDWNDLEGSITLTMGALTSTGEMSGMAADGSFTGVTWGETTGFQTGDTVTAKVTAKFDDENFYERVFSGTLGTVKIDDDPGNGSMFADVIAGLQEEIAPGGVGLDVDHTAALAAGWNKVSAGVPEPTSGLLLVLGGAMLALRRRRA